MKNKAKTIGIIVTLFIIAVIAIGLSGCQHTTKNYGGEMTIDLQPGENLNSSHGKMTAYGTALDQCGKMKSRNPTHITKIVNGEYLKEL